MTWTRVRDQLKNRKLLIRPKRGKYEKPLRSTESTKGLLGNKTSVVFHLCRRGLRSVHESSDLLVSDRIPAFKLFLGCAEKKKVTRLRVSVAPDMRLHRPVKHAGNGNESLFSTGFIIPGDVRAATSVELRILNCVAQLVCPPKWITPTNGYPFSDLVSTIAMHFKTYASNNFDYNTSHQLCLYRSNMLQHCNLCSPLLKLGHPVEKACQRQENEQMKLTNSHFTSVKYKFISGLLV
ncbi:hypothetical protein AMECASPLE_036173 [Ameca splendens]|uniref:Uncharacterized protein n=1 Tax=Ameca splendens TaxID=208324 RepID=A0ABV0ZVC5_9TELE